ncbi:MAG: hypothetical protein AAFR35_04725 [Pseudomonadota bacterium]
MGATKAGTSWLFRVLSDHPQTQFRTIKELHYFDSLSAGKADREIAAHQAAISRMEVRIGSGDGSNLAYRSRYVADRLEYIELLGRREIDTDAYSAFLSNGAPAGAVLGDFTPAYGLLPADILGQMAILTDDVRFLYVLRDPVERLWSHVRMIAARRAPDDGATPDRAVRILRRTLRGEEEEIARRGAYGDILRRLTGALPADRLHLAVFEEMVRPGGLTGICSALDIRPIAGERTKPAHVGPPLPLPEALRSDAKAWLEPEYRAAAEALGRMPDAWSR